ncbi:hypothetical protein [Brevundimonas sp.]|nr:hypothetical protein [Brevundimonas sp.]MDP3803263.1 hypothetical protein [Brevundimonas sp.]
MFSEGEGRCRLVWTADLLPDAMAPVVREMMGAGADVLKATVEKPPASRA